LQTITYFHTRGRKTVYELINVGKEIRQSSCEAIPWLRDSSSEFTNILIDAKLIPPSANQLLIESARDIVRDIQSNGSNIRDLTIADLGMFAHHDGSLKLLTMHKAKGREFDAVAIVDLHEGKVPHFSAGTDSERIDEAKRLLYVAITRARRIVMYITDNEDTRNRPSRFLYEDGLGVL
jgi:DNA helicase II / ATP-dependent DNA helicase PcrA